jgi:DNA mismatch repair protein MutS2
MIRIDKKTLEDLEFPTVLKQISNFCITEPGKEKVLSILPFKDFNDIKPELQRVKEFTASFEGDTRIPNHGFDAIFKELRLLDIENSTLETSGFRRILSISETTKALVFF